MTNQDERPPAPDGPDQLSPSRALRESVGATGSQRLGNSGPVANPTVSFPEEPPVDDAAAGRGA